MFARLVRIATLASALIVLSAPAPTQATSLPVGEGPQVSPLQPSACNNVLGPYAPTPNAQKAEPPSLSGITDLRAIPQLASIAGTTPFTSGVIRVRIACGTTIDSVAKKHGLTGAHSNWSPGPFDDHDRRAGVDRSFRIEVPAGAESEMVARLAPFRSDFDWVQLDWQFAGGLTYSPSDPCLATPQNSPCSGSASLGGQPNLIRANFAAAWDRTVSWDAIVIAVIDSGLRSSHEDIGAAKQKKGYDYVQGIETPPGTAVDDSRCSGGHGTQVGSIAAGATNNGKGVAGAGFNSSLLPMRVWKWNPDPQHLQCDIWASATRDWPIRWARLNGALIVNMSYYFLGPDPDEQAVMSESWNAGTTPIVSSANFERNIDTTPLYPCAEPFTICVGAVDNSGTRCANTGYGPISVELTAPSTYAWGAGAANDTNYIFDSCHTSYSTPLVAGAAALLRSLGANPQQQYNALCNTVRGNPLGQYKCGEINAGAAIWSY